MPESPADVRLDKWLWSVRLFKTRSLAIDACNAGHVKRNGERVKPARAVRLGDTYTALVGETTRIVKVVGLVEKRVGAPQVPQFMEDLTPPAEPERPREAGEAPPFYRPRGSGRPTKRDRRLLERNGWPPDSPG